MGEQSLEYQSEQSHHTPSAPEWPPCYVLLSGFFRHYTVSVQCDQSNKVARWLHQVLFLLHRLLSVYWLKILPLLMGHLNTGRLEWFFWGSSRMFFLVRVVICSRKNYENAILSHLLCVFPWVWATERVPSPTICTSLTEQSSRENFLQLRTKPVANTAVQKPPSNRGFPWPPEACIILWWRNTHLSLYLRRTRHPRKTMMDVFYLYK